MPAEAGVLGSFGKPSAAAGAVRALKGAGFADVRVRLRADGRLLVEPASAMPPAVGAWVCGPRWILAAVWTAPASGEPG